MRKFLSQWLVLAALALFALSGCSMSYSVNQSSDSLSQSSDSISASSSSSGSSGDNVAAALGHFLDDIRALAGVWTNKQQETTTFESELGALALSYGIGDWESESRVFYAIGQGLRQAGTDRNGISDQPFLQSDVMMQNSGLIVSGYWGT